MPNARALGIVFIGVLSHRLWGPLVPAFSWGGGLAWPGPGEGYQVEPCGHRGRRGRQRGQLPAGLRDAALVSLMSDALLRVSEAAALLVEDIEEAEDGSGRLTIRHSKTDQEGVGLDQYIGQPTLRRIKTWTNAGSFTAGPLFRRVRKGGTIGNQPRSSRSIRRIIQARAKAADLDGRFSGHSLRVGSAQSLAARGTIVRLRYGS